MLLYVMFEVILNCAMLCWSIILGQEAIGNAVFLSSQENESLEFLALKQHTLFRGGGY